MNRLVLPVLSLLLTCLPLAHAEPKKDRHVILISIDGFPAERGIIRAGYPGVLSAPPEQRPRALEIVFETPGLAPLPLRIDAAVIAVRSILTKYRQLLAHGPGI